MNNALEKSTITQDLLENLATELQVSCAMLRFWQEEFNIGTPHIALTSLQQEELRLVARATKTHQFRLDLVHVDLQNFRFFQQKKLENIEKLKSVRQLLQKLEATL